MKTHDEDYGNFQFEGKQRRAERRQKRILKKANDYDNNDDWDDEDIPDSEPFRNRRR